MHEAAAEDDVIGNESAFQLLHREEDFALPFFFAETIDSRNAKEIFDDVAVGIWEVAQLEWENVSFPNKSRTKSGAETEKQHASAAIASQRLHGRVIDDAHRFAKRFGKIKSDPAFAEMFRFFDDLPPVHRGRKTDRERVVIPAAGCIFELANEFVRAQCAAGIEFGTVARGAKQFDVGAADVDDEIFFLHRIGPAESDPARRLTRRRRSNA